jgi:hypothetical protein
VRLITSFTLLLALAALQAQTALAGPPSPGNSTIPSRVLIVGLGPAGPDSAMGQATCTYRDLANHPIPGAVVTLDFSACNDLVLASDQLDPRLLTNCAANTVSAVTDANGNARFTIMGSGTAAPAHPPRVLAVYADADFLGYMAVALLERDGSAGLTLADLSFWAADFFTGDFIERSDLDGSGYVSISDLSIWAAAYFNGHNVSPTGPYCP